MIANRLFQRCVNQISMHLHLVTNPTFHRLQNIKVPHIFSEQLIVPFVVRNLQHIRLGTLFANIAPNMSRLILPAISQLVLILTILMKMIAYIRLMFNPLFHCQSLLIKFQHHNCKQYILFCSSSMHDTLKLLVVKRMNNQIHG